jgi:hypothetical protein
MTHSYNLRSTAKQTVVSLEPCSHSSPKQVKKPYLPIRITHRPVETSSLPVETSSLPVETSSLPLSSLPIRISSPHLLQLLQNESTSISSQPSITSKNLTDKIKHFMNIQNGLPVLKQIDNFIELLKTSVLFIEKSLFYIKISNSKFIDKPVTDAIRSLGYTHVPYKIYLFIKAVVNKTNELLPKIDNISKKAIVIDYLTKLNELFAESMQWHLPKK